MSGINFKRVVLGGLLAGIIIFVLEGIIGSFYQQQMTEAMTDLGLSMDMSAGGFVKIILSCLLSGTAAIFFYAAVRPRFGPGPGTAIVVVLGLYCAGYLPTLIGYNIMGIFPVNLLILWAVTGLVEMIIAVLAGAAIYKEG